MKKTVLAILIMLVPFIINAAEVRYSKDIKPIFDQKCGGCHGAGTLEYEEWKKNADKLKKDMIGMKMDTFRTLVGYVVWPNTGALMRRLDNGENTKDGKPGNMYEYLGDTKEEREKNLALFKQWVGLWKLGRINDLSKEDILELNKIRERY